MFLFIEGSKTLPRWSHPPGDIHSPEMSSVALDLRVLVWMSHHVGVAVYASYQQYLIQKQALGRSPIFLQGTYAALRAGVGTARIYVQKDT